MPAGLQVWNASGQLTLDTSYYTGRMIGVIDCGNFPNSGSVTNGNFSTGVPFAIPILQLLGTPDPKFDFNLYVFAPSISIVGNTLSWSRPASKPNMGYPGCLIYYGVR